MVVMCIRYVWLQSLQHLSLQRLLLSTRSTVRSSRLRNSGTRTRWRPTYSLRLRANRQVRTVLLLLSMCFITYRTLTSPTSASRFSMTPPVRANFGRLFKQLPTIRLSTPSRRSCLPRTVWSVCPLRRQRIVNNRSLSQPPLRSSTW